MTRTIHREADLIERFLAIEAKRQREEKERHGLFLARQHDRRRKLLRALGVEHK